VRVALRTQQVIAHETGVASAIDPLGGSWHVEALTNRLEAEAYALFGTIDEAGGMVAAIERNVPQREIAEASYRFQREVEEGRRVVVGVNRYPVADDEPPPLHRHDPTLERRQVERLQAFRAGRDGARVEQRLAELSEAAARDDRNLLPPLVDAVRDGVTLGEICDAWRAVWGTWRERPVF
jgi:methylmalonyl-CoA mutase N-terminal domain/subunit